MGCCASTFQRAPTSARTARTILRPWRSPSTAGRERPWAGEHRPRLWTSSSDQLIQAVLRRPLESTGELDRQLADAQRRSADLEAKLAAEQAARQAVEAQREAERAEAETQASAAVKIDALTARIAAADKILDQTRDQLREKSEALLASERNLKEAAIETQRLERKLETVQRDLGQRLAEAEDFATTRADLIERAEALARTVAAKELALESAEDKAAKL